MKNFSPEVRNYALMASHGYCQCSEGCVEKATQMHHLLSNTKVNQGLYPLFLQSIFNCCPVNHNCHMTKPLPKITQAYAHVYEKYLELIVFKKI